MSKITPEIVAEVTQRLPASARVFSSLQDVLGRPEPDLNDIVELVRLDAGLSSGVVRIANSAHFRRGGRVESIAEAIQRIGLLEVNRTVGITLASQLYTARLTVFNLDGDRLWQNSIATAVCMSVLARPAGVSANASYTLGLFRGLGRVAMQLLAEAFDIRPLHLGNKDNGAVLAWEKDIFGMHNAELSATLLADWGFDLTMCAALRNHYLPALDPLRGQFTGLLHIACAMAEKLEHPLPCERFAWQLNSAPILAQAGIDSVVLKGCLERAEFEYGRVMELMSDISNRATP